MNEIDIKLKEFEIQTGKRPTAIYLGAKEYSHLIQILNEMSNSIFGMNIAPHNESYGGVKIYLVAEYSHVGIS